MSCLQSCMSTTAKESRLAFNGKERKQDCATTGKLVQNPLSLHSGKCTPCSDLDGKMHGKDELFEEMRGIGKKGRNVCGRTYVCGHALFHMNFHIV